VPGGIGGVKGLELVETGSVITVTTSPDPESFDRLTRYTPPPPISASRSTTAAPTAIQAPVPNDFFPGGTSGGGGYEAGGVGEGGSGGGG